jgi:FtsH-binding integral membrane protein
MRKYFYHRELTASFVIAAAGIFLTWTAFPLRGRESHTPNSWYETYNASRSACFLVFCIAALFCAFNAYRDKQIVSAERATIVIWAVLLCVLMLFSLSTLLTWWSDLRVELRPSWLQGI